MELGEYPFSESLHYRTNAQRPAVTEENRGVIADADGEV
jgi:hypothetical protein